jgi:hypothetical protein
MRYCRSELADGKVAAFEARGSNTEGSTIAQGATMLTNYLHHAMRHAHFEIMETGRFYGSIPGFQGVWSEGASLEECRDELIEVLEAWLVVKLRCRALWGDI